MSSPISKKRIGIIGATGSIGTQAIDVIMRNREMFELEFITGHHNDNLLNELKNKTGAKRTLCTDNTSADNMLKELIDSLDLDLVLHAVSGIGGIKSAYMVVDKGIDIALANKESLVTAGELIIKRASVTGSKIIPVDSEHSAVFQSLLGQDKTKIASITLTASGGPFRNRPKDAMDYVSLSEALKHPKWAMGQKISIDSATMMNKGLELIEARYLFDVKADKLNVVIHPESIIHSMVNFIDGSTIAQLGYPDMRTPISFALGFPDRIPSGLLPIKLSDIEKITFIKPDLQRFRSLAVAIEVLKSDSNRQMIMLNSSNEAAVMAFIAGKIRFVDIVKVVEKSLEKINFADAKTIDEALAYCKDAYAIADDVISNGKIS